MSFKLYGKPTILITGIGGSGASYLAEYILHNVPNISIIGTMRNHSLTKNIKNIEKYINIEYVDLTDFSSIHSIIDEYNPEKIFHIASMANVKNSFLHPLTTIQNNINITLNLLESVRLLKNKYGYNPIIKICSTSELYGNVTKENNPITESTPLNPINPYAVSKMTQDNLGYVYWLNYGLNVIRTRMFTYLNARRPDLFATAFGKQIIEIKQKKRLFLEHGNLDSVRSFIDVREAAEAYWISTEKGIIGDVYNIGGKTILNIKDFLNILIDKMGVKVETKQNKNLLRPSDISIQIPDMSKFTQHTGWEPKRSFDDTLNHFVGELYEFWE
jgi:GDP-4-dehydro-6-deoxy-D-mannose reductase